MTALTEGQLVHEARETAAITRTDKTVHDSGAVSYRTVLDHEVEASVEVWIDFRSLLRQTAAKAIRSKGKKAQLACGAIVVKARDARRLEGGA